MKKLLLVAAALNLGLAGCGTENAEKISSTDYISWGDSSVRSSTISDVRKETIKVCLSGSVSSENLERSKEWSKRSMLTWMRIFKSIDAEVTDSLTYTCNSPDITWNLRNGSGTSNASPSRINIYMSRPYGTWTHELGHAFIGLSDTYSGRTAGSCKSGQPASLMCWGAYGPRANPDDFSTLWQDDVDGAIANYKKVFGGELSAPDWGEGFDHTQPIDAENPWPEAVTVSEITMDQMDVVIDESLHEDVSFDIVHEDK